MRLRRLRIEISLWQVFIRSAVACSVAGVLLFGLSLQKIDPLPLDHSPLKFEANRAFQKMSELSKGFPNRVTWGETRKQAALWLREEFKKMGYTPEGMPFSETIAGKHYQDLENIYAEKRGTKFPDEIVVVSAHYDITDTTVEGAMDDGSGVGVVLELARVFSQEQPKRTLLFLLTDSEEFGSFWGARAFAKYFDRADKIISVLNFDFVAPEKQTQVLTLCDGLKEGFTPLWLRELALDSLRSTGQTKTVDFQNFLEFVERAMQIPPADHGAFLAAGIPAFNWVGQTNNFAYEMAHYHHTPFDNVEAMQPESFSAFGLGAERVIRTLDGLARLPEHFRESSYWKITSRLYIPGWAVTILHILAFIPFLIYSVTKFGAVVKRSSKSKIRSALRSESKDMSIVLSSLLLGYVVARLLPALRVITQYEIFPATQKSLLLYTPDFLAICSVFAAVVGAYLLLRKVFARETGPIESIELSHTFHAAYLTVIIILAMLKNSYLAVLLLLPPAYFWTAIRHRRRPEDRILNSLLLLSGAITVVITAVVMTTVFHVGVIYWYLFLATSYGLFSAYSVVLFIMSLTVMIRLFRAFVV